MYKIFSVLNLNSQCLNTPRVCTWHLTFFIYVINVSGKKLKAMCVTIADDNSLQYSLNNIAEMQCRINQDLKFYICGQNRGYSRLIQLESKQSFLH